MDTSGESATNQLMQKLLTTVSILQDHQDDVKELKSMQKYPQKQPCDGKGMKNLSIVMVTMMMGTIVTRDLTLLMKHDTSEVMAPASFCQKKPKLS